MRCKCNERWGDGVIGKWRDWKIQYQVMYYSIIGKVKVSVSFYLVRLVLNAISLIIKTLFLSIFCMTLYMYSVEFV